MTPYVDTPEATAVEAADAASLEDRGQRTEPTSNRATVVDPVCGMRLAPADAAASAEHDGRSHHFCSDACRDTFAADPARYTATPAGHDTTGAHDGHEPSAASREATDEHRRTHRTRSR